MKYVNQFNSKHIDLDTSTKTLNGGKGHNLIKMKSKGINVPSGIVITTEACNEYRSMDSVGKDAFLDELVVIVTAVLKKNVFPDASTNLVSIRSAGAASAPGMMDSLLNIGIGFPKAGLKANTTLAKDCTKRFVDMFLNVVHGLERGSYESTLQTEEGVDALFGIIKDKYKTMPKIFKASIKAVFDSWENERAKIYRGMHDIPEGAGTAVVIQSMVFGNYNDQSGSGVMFTRNPENGDNKVFGNFLSNCQGEDVVAGIVDAPPIQKMEDWDPELYAEIVSIGKELEDIQGDVQDVEFTIEDREIWILQTRDGERSSEAEIRIALDYVEEGKAASVTDMIQKGSVAKLRAPKLPENLKYNSKYQGVPSGGSISTGRVAKTVASTLDANEPVILVAKETTPEDIAAMNKAVGIVTTKGSITCHAAVVSRGMNKTCVVGCHDLSLSNLTENHYLLVDGKAGVVYVSESPFDVDLDPSLNVALVSRLLEKTPRIPYTVEVKDVHEARDFEDYLYKISVPSESMGEDTVSEDLAYLSEAFDLVVIKNHLMGDRVSDFIGVPMVKKSLVVATIESAIEMDMPNVFFNYEDQGTRTGALPTYRTMADVMDEGFLGHITEDFIKNVIGGYETFEIIKEQIDLGSRVVEYMGLLDAIELGLEIG